MGFSFFRSLQKEPPFSLKKYDNRTQKHIVSIPGYVFYIVFSKPLIISSRYSFLARPSTRVLGMPLYP